jgi:hypothetical protein
MWPFEEIIANPIPVIVGFLSMALAFYIYSKNKKLKSFRYEILTYEPILTSSEELSGKIKIYYETNQNNNIQIKDGFLFIVRLVNDGNVPIKSDDFYEPVSIFFGSDSEVLSAEIIKTNPGTLNAELDTLRSKHKIYIKPLLLNAKDSITIKALLTGFTANELPSIKVNARIVDIPEIKVIEPRINYRNLITFILSDPFKIVGFITLLILMIGLFQLGFTSFSEIGLDANFITRQAGDDANISIFVKDESIASSLMNDPGIIKASFPDYEVQPNITLIVQPNNFLSVPAVAVMKIHIGQDVQTGMYRIKLEVLQGLTHRFAFIFLKVDAGR